MPRCFSPAGSKIVREERELLADRRKTLRHRLRCDGSGHVLRLAPQHATFVASDSWPPKLTLAPFKFIGTSFQEGGGAYVPVDW